MLSGTTSPGQLIPRSCNLFSTVAHSDKGAEIYIPCFVVDWTLSGIWGYAWSKFQDWIYTGSFWFRSYVHLGFQFNKSYWFNFNQWMKLYFLYHFEHIKSVKIVIMKINDGRVFKERPIKLQYICICFNSDKSLLLFSFCPAKHAVEITSCVRVASGTQLAIQDRVPRSIDLPNRIHAWSCFMVVFSKMKYRQITID